MAKGGKQSNTAQPWVHTIIKLLVCSVCMYTCECMCVPACVHLCVTVCARVCVHVCLCMCVHWGEWEVHGWYVQGSLKQSDSDLISLNYQALICVLNFFL